MGSSTGRPTSSTSNTSGVSRRSVLTGGAAGAVGLAVGVAAGRATAAPAASDQASGPVAFRGAHQAGVVTAPQSTAIIASFDLVRGADRDALRRLFSIWTDDIDRLTSGVGALSDTEPELAATTGRLTVTVGVGAGAVRACGREVPAWLEGLPTFTVDRLEDQWNGGDLVVQICGNEPVAVAHALRQLTKDARTLATPRWVQRGFRGRTGDDPHGRNLMGQIDGTQNPASTELEDLVWIGASSRAAFGDQPAWLTGGTTMVVRRIAMDLDGWDELDRLGRERAIGRHLDDGTPLTGGRLTDRPDLDALGENQLPVIDSFAHVRRARHDDPRVQILRRPYNYDDAPTGATVSNSGLLFISFQADVERQFVPIQQRLAELDLLNNWTTPVGSAVFAVLPGARPGQDLGAALVGRP